MTADAPITAAEVLDFIDTFAGQENTAEEVRDFVQAAARHVHEGKTRDELAEDEVMSSFIGWLRERHILECKHETTSVAKTGDEPEVTRCTSDCGAVLHIGAIPRDEEDLGFIDRANVPVGEMRRSIHRSHRGEGQNFVD